MAFTTAATVKSDLADILKKDTADLDSYWDNIIADARDAAYQEILSRLLARGISLSNITSWDRGVEYERDISLYWCLVKGAGLANYDDRLIKLLDRRLELDKVMITVGGALITQGKIGYGSLDDDNQTFKRQVSGDEVTEHNW